MQVPALYARRTDKSLSLSPRVLLSSLRGLIMYSLEKRRSATKHIMLIHATIELLATSKENIPSVSRIAWSERDTQHATRNTYYDAWDDVKLQVP